MQMDSAQPAVERVVREPVGAPGDDVAPERRERERPRSRGAPVRVERDERVRAPAQLAKPRRELEVAHAVGTDRLAGSHHGEEPREVDRPAPERRERLRVDLVDAARHRREAPEVAADRRREEGKRGAAAGEESLR